MKIVSKITELHGKAYEKVAYDWKVPLRLSVIRRALDPKLSQMSLEILSNNDFIERNHMVSEQNGRSSAFWEVFRLTREREGDKEPFLETIEEVADYASSSMDNCDRTIARINNQWSDQVGISRYPADHPNNFATYSRNHPRRV